MNRKPKFLVFLLFLILSLSASAQGDEKGTIDAQRPTLTESYSIIVPNTFQFESGLDYNLDSKKFNSGTFVRGSITSRFELRVFTDYKHLNTVGGKFIALEPEKSDFGIGASFVYSRELQNKNDDFRIAMTKSFEQLFVTYNFGYNEYIYTIALIGMPITDKVNCFVEYFNDPNMNRIHSGFTWIPQRDIQFDINGGWMDSNDWYAGIGFSFRIR